MTISLILGPSLPSWANPFYGPGITGCNWRAIAIDILDQDKGNDRGRHRHLEKIFKVKFQRVNVGWKAVAHIVKWGHTRVFVEMVGDVVGEVVESTIFKIDKICAIFVTGKWRSKKWDGGSKSNKTHHRINLIEKALKVKPILPPLFFTDSRRHCRPRGRYGRRRSAMLWYLWFSLQPGPLPLLILRWSAIGVGVVLPSQDRTLSRARERGNYEGDPKWTPRRRLLKQPCYFFLIATCNVIPFFSSSVCFGI